MNRRIQLQALIAVLFAGMMFSSCGNIDIVKRKYRPGFHVDVSKKRQKMKTAEGSAVADKRKAEKVKLIEAKEARVEQIEIDENLSASVHAKPSTEYLTNKEKKANLKRKIKSREYRDLSFERKMQVIKREAIKPTPNSANLEWMKWVSFGTGIGSLAFGAMALIFAILTVVFFTGFLWGAIALALLLGGAAITFSILYKKNNGTDPKARLGMIFGIIGAGLAVLAIILGAIFWSIYWL